MVSEISMHYLLVLLPTKSKLQWCGMAVIDNVPACFFSLGHLGHFLLNHIFRHSDQND